MHFELTPCFFFLSWLIRGLALPPSNSPGSQVERRFTLPIHERWGILENNPHALHEGPVTRSVTATNLVHFQTFRSSQNLRVG
jgi:hypothetical protein